MCSRHRSDHPLLPDRHVGRCSRHLAVRRYHCALPGRLKDAHHVRAEIMYNRTAIGVVYNSSAPCPFSEGPCRCQNGTDGTSMHTCQPWDAQTFPYGSEFAFDTTGQEEVYVWARQALTPSDPDHQAALAQMCYSMGLLIFWFGKAHVSPMQLPDLWAGLTVLFCTSVQRRCASMFVCLSS